MRQSRARGERHRYRTLASSLAVGFGLLAGAAAAQDQAATPETNLTLSASVDLAVRGNAELRSLRARRDAMRARPAQAGALDNPMFKYGGMDQLDGGDWPNTGEKRFMVEQAFPWFGKRGLREGLAAKEAEVMQHELDAMTLEVAMKVKESYYDLYAVQRVTAITREEEDVLRRMAKVAETLYATGERSQADVIKAQSEITMLKQKCLELQAQEVTLKAKLNTLFDRRADEALGWAATPPQSGLGGNAEALFAMAATNRPEVQVAQAQVERYEMEKELMAKESLPDYQLGVEYRNFSDSADMVMLTIGIDLPIRPSKYRAGVREAVAMREASESARQAAIRQSALDVQEASFKLQTALRTLELYRTELIPQAEARFGASEAGYRAGKVDFMDLLESERFLLGVKMMTAMTEGTVGMQAARLERALGRDPREDRPRAAPAGKKGSPDGH